MIEVLALDSFIRDSLNRESAINMSAELSSSISTTLTDDSTIGVTLPLVSTLDLEIDE